MDTVPIQNTDVDVALAELLLAAEEVNRHIDVTNQHSSETFLHVVHRVDSTVAEVDTLYADIDQAETQAEEELDRLILEEVKSNTEDTDE